MTDLACTNVAGLARIWHTDIRVLVRLGNPLFASRIRIAVAQLTAERMLPLSLRIGVDLIRVADVAEALERFGDRYATRVFTERERSYCGEDRQQAAQRFAARFAAKEAAMKVLRPSANDGVAWQSIEVRRLDCGASEIELHGAALALAARGGIAELSLSMSHEREYATATVVARLTTPHR